MSLLFISHSSKDNAQALALHDWLADKGWDNIFLDVSQERGLTVGNAWRDELTQYIKRCDAMLLLISKDWLASRECLKELTIAIHENKIIYGLLIEDIPVEKLDDEIRAQQLVNLCDIQDYPITVSMPTGDSETVHFSKQALDRFYKGLEAKGLTPEGFVWPPLDEPDRKPYRGLEPLQAEDAGIFFGRDADTQKLLSELETLRKEQPPRFLSILGASGAGKSSFMRASILPRLARRPSLYAPLPIVRPESAVLSGQDGLHNALSKAFKQYGKILTKTEIISALQDNALALFAGLAQLARLPQTEALPTLIIAIDQAEELFNSEGKAESHDFLTLLNDIIRQNSVPIMVLCTIRSNAFELLQTTTLLTGVQQQTYSLQPIAKGAYQQIIEGPVKLLKNSPNALTIDPNLTQALLDDIDKGTSKDALPLLAFTLEQLYLEQLHNDDDKRTLTLSEYETMGKIEGAIEKTVQKALTDAKQDPNVPNDDDQCLALLKQGLIPWLAGIDKETREPKRKVAKLSDIPEVSRPLMKYFIDNRLLSVSRIKDAEGNEIDTIEPAHESVLRQWGKLKGWLDDDFVALTTHDALKSATLDWKRNKRDKQWLNHKQGRLADAEELLKNPRFADAIEPEQRDYLKVCRQKERNSQRLLIAGFFFALFLAGVATLFGYWSYENEQLARAETVRANEQSEIADKKTAEAEKSKAAAEAETQKTQEALIEANHNYALALNEKAIQAEKEGNIEYAKLYALHALKNAKTDYLLSASPGIISSMGYESNVIWSSGFNSPLLSWIDVVSFSSDGKVLTLVGGSRNSIRLWDMVADKELTVLQGYSHEVNSVSFSPDGKTLALSYTPHAIHLWDLSTGKQRSVIKAYDFMVDNMSISPDGRFLALESSDHLIHLWDASTGKELSVLQGHTQAVSSISFSPDGKTLALGSRDHAISLWDVKTGKELTVLQGHTQAVSSVSFSPDGKILASGSWDNTMRLWDVKMGKEIAVLQGHTQAVSSVSFSPDGKILASGSVDNTIRLWDVKTGKELTVLQGHTQAVSSVSFSPDGKTLLSISRDKIIRLWGMTTNKKMNLLQSHADLIRCVSFSPDGKTLASGSQDNTIRLWDVNTGKELTELQGHTGPVYSVSFSPDGKILASGSKDNTIRLWDVKTGKALAVFQGHASSVSNISFSPDGKILVSGSVDKTIRLWDVNTGKELTVLQGHTGPVFSVSFSPDGKILALGSGSWNYTIRLWDVKTGKEIAVLQGHTGSVYSVSFSPNGNILASGSGDKTIRLWDVKTGKEIAVLQGHTGSVSSISFSPDGKTLASGSKDNTIRLWDVKTGKEIAVLQGHTGSVYSVSFSPDGKILVSGSGDKTIRLWDVDILKAIHRNQFAKTELLITNFEKQSGLHLEQLNIIPKEPNFFEQEVSKPNYPKTHPFHWLPLAENGDANAMLQLGIIEHRDSHWEKAREWYQKALDAGNPDAEERLRILALTKQYEEASAQDVQ